jgi:pseudouridine 5'-phosphatase
MSRDMPAAFPKITHVLYDMDGLLLDTEPFYTEVTQRIVARYGRTFDWSVKSKMIGQPPLASAGILIEALNLPITPEEYLAERKELLAGLFPQAEAMPGARRLTEHLARHGIPQAVATSSHAHEFELKVTRHRDWFTCFQCIILGDDPEVRRGKPSPDIFLAAAARLGARAESCLVLEDAPAGVTAARAAGMSVVAVPNSGMNPEACRGADQILPSLEFFDLSAWGLPSF